MKIKYDPRMKRMKISHIMREYNVPEADAIVLRGGGAAVQVENTKKSLPKEKADVSKSNITMTQLNIKPNTSNKEA